jgi:glucose/arabinose dehydrogenase
MDSLCTTTLPGALVAADFCAYQVPVDVNLARGILAVGESDFLTLERGTSSVVFVHDSDRDGLPDSRLTVAYAEGINHGLAIDNGYLYASSDSTVYRWSILGVNNNSFLEAVGQQEIIIHNMNEESDGSHRVGHQTRTLEFDDRGRLLVPVGFVNNIDEDSFRSRIRRFDLTTASDVVFPIDFITGEVFANGLRNEVGLAFDKHGVLWGVENSADNLFREDLGGDIHQDNPAEELNRFREEDKGQNWGYPQCWTEFNIPGSFGVGQGAVFAWPSFLREGTTTDEECRANTIPPLMALQGHSAPLGMTFYNWKDPSELSLNCAAQAAFPREFDGFAFIAYHGSWNRDIPTGYKVVYVEMDSNGDPVGNEPYNLLMHEPPNAQWED